MLGLSSMRNVGKENERNFKGVEICSAEELRRIGRKEAFFRLRTHCLNVCLVHLYALQGTIENIEYNRLSDETKQDLKGFYNSLK